MRVLVCGGRSYRDPKAVKQFLSDLHMAQHITLIIEGGALGVDCYAAEWADEQGISLKTFHADWKKYGKVAGPMRNQQMIDAGKPDHVVAFPGGRGTADMVRRAKSAGLPVQKVEPSKQRYDNVFMEFD